MDRLYPWRHSARRLTRRRVFGLTAGTALAASLAACGRSKGGGAPAASGSQASPKSGGRLSFSYPIDPNTFDPASMMIQAGVALNFTNDRLVKLKAGPDVKYDDLIVAPELASRWEVPDAQTYVFHLNPGARFADLPPLNGRPVTAADVKWSFEYLSRTGELKNLPRAPSTALFPGLQSVTTPDQATVSIQLGQPYTSFIYNTTQNESSVLAHEIFDADGDFSKRAAGTGPWQIDTSASTKGARWVFKKNRNYFMPGRPYVDEVNWLVLPDAATRRAAFESGQLDILEAADISPDLLPELKRAVSNVVVYEALDAQGGFYMNESKPPLNDVRIRQAISLAIDRDDFIAVFAKGKGEWALRASLPGLFTPQEVREVLKYDPVQAKQLLKEAGYPDGLTLEFIYPGDKFGKDYIAKLELLQSQLGKSGMTVKLTSLDAPTASERLHSGAYSLYMTPGGGATGISYDPGAQLDALFDPASGVNYGRVNDPKLTSLLKAVQAETDPGKRKEDIRAAARYANEASHGLTLYYATNYTLWHPYVNNYAPQLGVPEYYVDTSIEK